MDKQTAIKNIARESNSNKVTETGYKKIKACCKVLELTVIETMDILIWLDFTKFIKTDKMFIHHYDYENE